MQRTQSTVIALIIPFIFIASSAFAQPPKVSSQDKRKLRAQVTQWLRARQQVLTVCEGCAGRGVLHRPKVDSKRGLVSVEVKHKRCFGTGARIRTRSFQHLYRPFLEEATALPGMGEEKLSELEVREILDDEELSPKEKRRTLTSALGITKRSAQVRRMKFRLLKGSVLSAQVSTSVPPYRTTWIRIDNEWKLVAKADFELALKLALGQDRVPDDQGEGDDSTDEDELCFSHLSCSTSLPRAFIYLSDENLFI